MRQATMFGGVKARETKTVSRQTGLPFRASVDSGRLSDPHPVWLDQVLGSIVSAGGRCPTLTQLQDAWNRRRSPEQAATEIKAIQQLAALAVVIRGQLLRLTVSPAGDTPATPRPVLALPAPVKVKRSRAKKRAR